MTNSDNNTAFADNLLIHDLTTIADLMQKDVAGRVKAMEEKMKHFSSHVICDDAIADLRAEIEEHKGSIEGGKRIIDELRKEIVKGDDAYRERDLELSAENRDLHEQVQEMTNQIALLNRVAFLGSIECNSERGKAMDDYQKAASEGFAGN